MVRKFDGDGYADGDQLPGRPLRVMIIAMTLTLFPGEPEAGPWRVATLMEVMADLQSGLRSGPGGRAPTIAVDGRSAAGKSTVSAR